MASLVAKGLSDLLKLEIVLQPAAAQQGASKPIPELDLDSLHKYSLHWVSATGTVLPIPSAGNAGISPKMQQVATPAPLPKAGGGSNAGTSGSEGNINISVKTLTGKQTSININPQSSVSDLKNAVREANGLQNEGIKLLYHNKKIEDEATLAQSSITSGATLFMIVTMESIAPTFYMNETTFLDSRYDYQYAATDGAVFSRGNRRFTRPCGWTKKALLVLTKYENDLWLGVTSRQSETASANGEWPVAYHGTNKDAVERFCKYGGTLRSRGRLYKTGKGIYTTPSPTLAEEQTDSFEFQGVKYKMIFMDRVCMDYTAEYELGGPGGGTYFITSEEKVRPYCVLLKRV